MSEHDRDYTAKIIELANVRGVDIQCNYVSTSHGRYRRFLFEADIRGRRFAKGIEIDPSLMNDENLPRLAQSVRCAFMYALDSI